MQRRKHQIELKPNDLDAIINSKTISKGTPNYRKYRNVPILHPGTFTDSLSKTPITYTGEVIRKSINNWEGMYVDLDHDIGRCLSRIGWVENPREKHGVAYVDIKLLGTPMVLDEVVTRIDAGLINAVSCELYTKDRYENGETTVEEILFDGLGIVVQGADPKALIKNE
jgi:hypothetical protein